MKLYDDLKKRNDLLSSDAQKSFFDMYFTLIKVPPII